VPKADLINLSGLVTYGCEGTELRLKLKREWETHMRETHMRENEREMMGQTRDCRISLKWHMHHKRFAPLCTLCISKWTKNDICVANSYEKC
jgi:hypothetical protein